MNLEIQKVNSGIVLTGVTNCLKELLEPKLNSLGMPIEAVPVFSIEEFYKQWHSQEFRIDEDTDCFLDTLLLLEKIAGEEASLESLMILMEQNIQQKDLPPLIKVMHLNSINWINKN